MNEISVYESLATNDNDLIDAPDADAAADLAAPDLGGDEQEFLDLMQGETGQPTEAEMQEQFDTNFQNFSYLFLKSVFSYVEEEVSRQG